MIVVTRFKQSNYENKSRGETPNYQPGDKVLLSTADLSLKVCGEAGNTVKWKHRWVGLFEVIAQESNTVEIKLMHAWAELHSCFHFELLKPFHAPPGSYDKPAPELNTNGVKIYEVEKIINHRWNGHRKQFEWGFKWKGYADSDNTWEPLETLVRESDLLSQYHETHGIEVVPTLYVSTARTYGVTWIDNGQFDKKQLEMVFEYENQWENAGYTKTESRE